jgi:hypothetical protein
MGSSRRENALAALLDDENKIGGRDRNGVPAPALTDQEGGR